MPADAHLPQPWRHPAFHEMRTRIETLEEENRQLREALTPIVIFPKVWGLSPQETRLLAALHSTEGCASIVRVCAATAWPGGAYFSDAQLKVVLCGVRKKVRPFGVEIVTRHHFGLTLGPGSRAILDEAVRQVQSGEAA